MKGFNSKLRRLKYHIKHDYASIENVVLVLAIVMCLVWTYQSIEAMSRNWALTEKLGAERRNLELISVEIETAELENEYYKSAEYQELAARRLLNKQLPGEHMVALPENSEVAKSKHQSSSQSQVEAAPAPERSNIDKWLLYLFPSY